VQAKELPVWIEAVTESLVWMIFSIARAFGLSRSEKDHSVFWRQQ